MFSAPPQGGPGAPWVGCRPLGRKLISVPPSLCSPGPPRGGCMKLFPKGDTQVHRDRAHAWGSLGARPLLLRLLSDNPGGREDGALKERSGGSWLQQGIAPPQGHRASGQSSPALQGCTVFLTVSQITFNSCRLSPRPQKEAGAVCPEALQSPEP